MENCWHYAALIVALQACAAFFAATETAMTTVSRARLHQLEQQGNERARIAAALRENKEQLLSTLLIGNTLANIGTGVVVMALLVRLLQADSMSAALLATCLATFSLLVLSEVLPRTLALQHALALTLAVAPLMRALAWLFMPVSWSVIAVTRLLLFLLRSKTTSVTVADDIEELKGAIDLHHGPEAEVAQERAMLRSILDLTNVEVKSIMVHRRLIDTIDASLPAPEIVEKALQTGFTRIPLWKGAPENIIGILHAKALLREIRRVDGDLGRLDIAKVATRPWFIPASTSLLEQLQAFRARREHFALVVDEYGALQGIVTLEDILEEIVGDIGDETDSDMPGVIRQPNGALLVEGSVTLRDLNRQFEWDLPETEAATVAGLVLHEARRVPEVGQTYEFHGLRFEILRRQRNQVTQLRLWKIPPAGKAASGGA